MQTLGRLLLRLHAVWDLLLEAFPVCPLPDDLGMDRVRSISFLISNGRLGLELQTWL